MTQTFTTGKDHALEHSIASMRLALRSLGFTIEETHWLNPVPHVWSVRIQDIQCPQIAASGRGSTQNAALASACGELLERLSTRILWAHTYLTPVLEHFDYIHQPDERWFSVDGDDQPWHEQLMDPPCRATYNPSRHVSLMALIDSHGDSSRGVCTLPFIRQCDGQTIWFPVSLLAQQFESIGMASGNSREEAQVQALSEILEHAIKARIIRESLILPEVPDDVIHRYPNIKAGLDALKIAGLTPRVLDGSLGGRYPVMCLAVQNPNDGGLCAAFGAHPCMEVALERTLTGLLEGRAPEQLDGFPAPSTLQGQVTSADNIKRHVITADGQLSWSLLSDSPDTAFVDWNDDRDDITRRDGLMALIHQEGTDVYILESAHLGMYTCRIIAPGVSDVEPPGHLAKGHHRLILAHRATLFNLSGATRPAWQALLDDLDAADLNDKRLVLDWAGIIADPGSAWARLRTGELKLWLALALGRQEDALTYLRNVLSTSHLSSTDKGRLRALRDVMELNLNAGSMESYRPALNSYHGEALVEEAEELVDGVTVFPDLAVMDPYRPTEAHGRFLDAYARVLLGQAGQ